MSNPNAVIKQADVVIVGSGPGGATLARGLARAGRKVILLERGRDWRTSPLYATYPGAMLYTDRASFLYTHEGLNIIRPLMAGGATSMYCGCAARPPAWLKDKYGIDLERYVDAAIGELNIAPLSVELRGAASTRLAEAADELGYHWQPLLKFMNPARTKRFDCGAKCMLGCRCGAKWNAAEWVDDAIATGCCEFITAARVEEIIVTNRKVIGVRARVNGQWTEFHAPIVSLSAGGIGTPLLLQRAGVQRAGDGLGMDTTLMVYGASKQRGNGNEPPMTYEWANDDVGYLLSTLIDPWLNYPLVMGFKGLRELAAWARWNHTLGIMIKLKDDVAGRVSAEHDIHKPLTVGDRRKMEHALGIAKKILVKAGTDEDSLLLTPLRGTHPCATARIGDLLDTNLQTEIENLYVCDASAFPEALARPTVLTIIGLGQRLVEHLLQAKHPA